MTSEMVEKKLLSVALMAAMLLLGSCHTSKQVAEEGKKYPQSTDVAGRYEGLVSSYRDWKDVTVPLRLQLVEPSSMSISGKARMVRGRCVNLSFRFLGMEVAQLHLTNDSVYAVYRMKKQYVAEDLKGLTGQFPFTIDNVQDLVMGRAFLVGERPIGVASRSKFDFEPSGDAFDMVPKEVLARARYGFRVGVSDVVERMAAYALDGTVAVTVSYPSCESTVAGPLAATTEIELQKGRRKVVADIEWRWDDARWNKGGDAQWQVPEGYTRLRAADLVKMLTGK